MTIEDKLIVLLLIKEMHDPALEHKLLETLQSVNSRNMYRVRVATGIDKKYKQQPNEGEAYRTNK